MLIRPDSELGFRALSVKQPWANEIATGEHTIDFRSWATDYRGDLLIHASNRAAWDIYPDAPKSRMEPCGVTIAIVTLADVVIVGKGVEAHFIFERPRPVPHIPAKGAQYLWKVSPALARQLGVSW